jgi:hypothetical protein
VISSERSPLKRQVGGLQVQAGPQQLRPKIVGDHPRIGRDEHGDAARERERATRVKAAGEPLPLLAVPEEGPRRHQNVRLGARRDRLALPRSQGLSSLDVVADRHPVDGRHPRGTRGTRPLGWLGDIGQLRGQPAPGLRHDRSDDGAHFRGERRRGVPALHPGDPGGVGPLDDRRGVVAGAHRHTAVPEGGDGALEGIEDG